MDPLVIGIAVTVLLAFVFAAAGLRGNGGRTEDPLASRLEAFRFEGQLPQSTGQPKRGSLREKRSYSGLPVLSAFLSQFSGSEAVAIHLERAAVPLRVGEYYLIRWGTAGLFLIVPALIGRFQPFYLLLAIGCAVVGYMLPAMWINNKKKSRANRINQQLVDLLGLVSNSLKSGYGLMQSFEFASKQMQPPIAVEIRRMLRESNLGMSAEDALNALGDRIDSSDLDMVLTAINIQRTVGGNLAEILDKVAATMRERERIRGEINTLTAQQKMTGIVIGGLPVFMFAIFMVMNPGYMSLLFTEAIGKAILGTAIFLEILGYFSMRKIMAIEV